MFIVSDEYRRCLYVSDLFLGDREPSGYWTKPTWIILQKFLLHFKN